VRALAAKKNCGCSHVFCLQEVADLQRAEIKALTENGFTLYKKGDHSDVAIALKSEHFTDIKDLSIRNGSMDAAIVMAKDKETGLKCLFVSAHIPGFPH